VARGDESIGDSLDADLTIEQRHLLGLTRQSANIYQDKDDALAKYLL